MKKFKYNIALLGLTVGLLAGCTGNFEEMNKNPLQPIEVSPALLLPKMQQYGFNCRSWEYQVGENLHTNQYAQYMACSTSNFLTDRYVWNDAWVKQSFWPAYYTYISKNQHNVKQMLAAHPEYDNMYQVMRIMATMVAARTTDLFGDIPYFEAGQGNLEPAYDSQKDIYYDLFKELKEAAESLKNNQSDPLQNGYGTSDLIYDGDLGKWIKLANSIRLRLALRLSFIDPDKAKSEGEAAISGGLLSSNDETAGIKQTTNDNGHSLWCISFWNEFRVSKTMIDIMLNESSVEDPRLPMHFSQTQGYAAGKYAKKWQGIPNGLPASLIANPDYPEYNPINVSCIWGYNSCGDWNAKKQGSVGENDSPNQYYALVTKPVIILNYAEVCFLKAEAALRGWNGAGNVKDNYEAGIRASFDDARDGADAAYIDTSSDELYINGGNVKWNDGTDFEGKLKKIITQKWIAIYPNGVEAWTEFRRTGYPAFTPVVKSDLSLIKQGEFIKKLRYVDDEQTLNSHATDPALNSGQGDGQNVRVWWDTKRYK